VSAPVKRAKALPDRRRQVLRSSLDPGSVPDRRDAPRRSPDTQRVTTGSARSYDGVHENVIYIAKRTIV